MKYILMFQVCSLIAQQCYPVMTDREPVDAWSKCVEKGIEKTKLLIKTDRDAFDKHKYIVRLYCKNEDNSNKTPTSSKQFEQEV